MARDSRTLPYPPGARECESALSSYVSARMVALIIRTGNVVDIGSATCITIADRYFLATAAHNLVEGAEIRIIPKSVASEFPILARSHPQSSKIDPDVAWIELDRAVVESGEMKFIGLGDLLCEARHDPKRVFLVQGYPAYEVKTLQRNPLELDLLSMGLITRSLIEDDESGYLVLEYPPQDPGDAGLELPSPKGMSGGGVWRFQTFSEARIWTPEGSKLLAVVATWSEARNRLSYVQVEHWLDRLVEDLPELSCYAENVTRLSG